MTRRDALARRLVAHSVTVDGWSIELQDGLLNVRDPKGHLSVVDVRNPLQDRQLVEFHRRSDVPESLKNIAEGMASQWRRLIHTTGQWEEMRQQSLKPMQ